MKTKLLLSSMTLASLLLCSCHEKGAIPLDPTPPRHITQAARLHLSIHPSNGVTLRSATQDPMNEIRSLRLLFYNAQSAQLEHIREVHIGSSEQLNNIAVDLPKAAYKLVAIGNPTPSIAALTQVGAPLTHLTEPHTLSSPDIYSIEDNNHQVNTVLMTPEQGPVEVPESSFTPRNAPTVGAISMKLEPAVARILVYGTPEVKQGKRGVAAAQFVLSNLPTKVAIIRPLGLLANGTAERVGDASEPRNRYASGSLFTAWQGATPSTLVGLINQHTTLPASSYWAVVAEDLSRAQASISAPNYSKEAVLPPQAYIEGATPCLILSFPYVPANLELTGNEGWVSFEGQHYTETSFKQFIAPRAVVPNTRLAAAIQRASLSTDSFDTAFDKEGIKFYKNALSYYVLYIRHFSDEQAPNPSSAGRYGLVRNNEYRLKLRSISAAGSPVFPNLRSRMTPLSELHRLKAAVIVQPTITREIDVDL